MLHDYLSDNLFTQNPADHCVYTKDTEDQKVIIVIWVDDLVIAASDDNVMMNVKEMLTAKFKMKDLGKLNNFLGIDFQQSDHCVKMSQKRYVRKYLTDLICKIVSHEQHLVSQSLTILTMQR